MIPKVQALINRAKKLLDNRSGYYDPHLANYILRDSEVVEQAGLKELSWVMHKEGCVKDEVEYLIEKIEDFISSQDAR